MGTSAFDRVWGDDPKAGTSAFDAAWDSTPAKPNIHDEFKSGRLAKRMARANANDREEAEADDPTLSTLIPGALANVSHGIPGAEAVQARARSFVRRQPYKQALQDIRGTTAQIPGAVSAVQRFSGAVPLAAILPGSPAVAGALVGAADGAMDADPDVSLGERGVRSALGAAGGALLGKGAEMGVTLGRTLLATGPAKNILARQATRAARAQSLYSAAIREGKDRLGTKAVQRFLSEPDIAEIVGELQQTHSFKNVAGDSPEMLDAVYKTLSDRVGTIKKGMESISPNRPNIGRFRLEEVRGAQSRLLDALSQGETVPGSAIETAQSPAPSLRDAIGNFWDRQAVAAARNEGTVEQQLARRALERHGAESSVGPRLTGAPPERQVPGMMPSYRNAVEDFAEHSSGIEGVQKGYDALRVGVANRMPRAANLTRTTPEALGVWGSKASPTEIQGASEGVLGAAKMALHNSLLGEGRRAISQAPSLLREIGSPRQHLLDMLTRAGLLGANALTRP